MQTPCGFDSLAVSLVSPRPTKPLYLAARFRRLDTPAEQDELLLFALILLCVCLRCNTLYFAGKVCAGRSLRTPLFAILRIAVGMTFPPFALLFANGFHVIRRSPKHALSSATCRAFFVSARFSRGKTANTDAFLSSFFLPVSV